MAKPWEEYSEKKPWEEYQAPKKEEPEESTISKVIDYGLRGLDYVDGLSRAALLSQLNAPGANNVFTTDDWKRALKGDAPMTAEMLGRAGMKDGWKKTTAGIVGDVLSSPATLLSGGTGAAMKAGKLKPLYHALTASDLPFQGLGKVAGKAYDKIADVTGTLAETFSGASKDALKEYANNPKLIKLIGKDPQDFVRGRLADMSEAMSARKKQVVDTIKNIGGDTAKADISGIKKAISDKIEPLATRQAGKGLGTEATEKLTSLRQTYDDAFNLKNADGEIVGEVPDIVNLADATEIKRAIKETGSGGKTIFDKKGNQRTIQQLDEKFLQNLYGKTNDAIDSAYGASAKESREAYTSYLKDRDLLKKNLTDIDPVSGQAKAYQALESYGKGQKGKKVKMAMDNIEENLGHYDQTLNIKDTAGKLQATQQMLKPGWLPISSNSVVATGRIATTAAAGGLIGGNLGADTRSGAAGGIMLGAMLASPASMRRVMRSQQLMKKGAESIPVQMYRRATLSQQDKDQ